MPIKFWTFALRESLEGKCWEWMPFACKKDTTLTGLLIFIGTYKRRRSYARQANNTTLPDRRKRRSFSHLLLHPSNVKQNGNKKSLAAEKPLISLLLSFQHSSLSHVQSKSWNQNTFTIISEGTRQRNLGKEEDGSNAPWGYKSCFCQHLNQCTSIFKHDSCCSR